MKSDQIFIAKNKLIKVVLFAFVLLLNFSVYSQSFEGWISYKVETLNPNSELIPDSTWQKMMKEKFGDKGYIAQKYYYKENNYIAEIEAGNEKGFQAFSSADGLIYSWQENSNKAVAVDSKNTLDEFIEIVETDQTDNILGIECKCIVVKSSLGETTLWYNSDYFKIDPNFYKGFKNGHWEQIINKIECIPLKIENKGFMSNTVQEATAFEEIAVDESRFTIPKFKEVYKNPLK